MIQNTANKAISELFSADNKVVYYIPKYQREYVWSKWNWEALFDDIDESDGGHFLGSIICINTEKDSHKAATLELVDGQQRMTTLSLLYLAVYKFLKENIPDPTNMNAQLEILGLRNRLILSETNTIRLTPSYTNSNLDDYKWIIGQEIQEAKISKKPRFLGNRQISRAFNYFLGRLNETDEFGHPVYTYEDAKALLSKLNSATIVKIDVISHADAFTLFETLNNRGIPLSAIDLIKNKLLGQLDKKNKNTSIDQNFERWNLIIKNLSDDYNIQERFLRQFYNAFKWDKEVEVVKIPKALRSNLIRIYEDLIERDVDGIFNRLEEASALYSRLIQYDTEENSRETIQALRNLENVNGSDGYMLLLFVSKRFELGNAQFIQLVNFICKYFIRRNITDFPPTRDLTNYFMNIIEVMNNLPSYNFETVREIIIKMGKPASDTLFEDKLRGDLYEENTAATRYVLSSIELADSQTKEKYINFYDRDKNKFIWTVEHILPQGENIPADWIKMIAKGDKELANQIQKSFVHKLGNLTLTGYNPNLSNLSLAKKQERKNTEGKYIGYKNGLTINDDIANIELWTKEKIESRTDKLVQRAINIFKL